MDTIAGIVVVSDPSLRPFPRRLNMPLPNDMALSLISRGGLLLDDERWEDFLERTSGPSSQDGASEAAESCDDDFDETVLWLKCLSRREERLSCLFSARIRSGDGGPSTEGPNDSVEKLFIVLCETDMLLDVCDVAGSTMDGVRCIFDCNWLNMSCV